MPILLELKLELIEALSEQQKKIKTLPVKLLEFMTQCTRMMAEAETAADLSQSVRELIERFLAPSWVNPLWYFSYEYEIRLNLLTILNKEAYSLINLLIKTNKEDRQMLDELKKESQRYDKALHTAGISPGLISDYEHTLSAYRVRHEMDQRRIAGLTKTTEELMEENERLKESMAAAALLHKLKLRPEFASLLMRTELSLEEKALLGLTSTPETSVDSTIALGARA